jgi:drug/metabolite transporter (DMT)-like permease
VITAWVFLGEGLRAIQWLGAALVLAATLMATVWEAAPEPHDAGLIGAPPSH